MRSGTLARLAVAGALVAATAACGGSGGDSGGGKIELRFTWWGSDVRHQVTQKAIQAFEAANPNITVKGEYGEWNGYWDKLATTVAANDAPDVIQMDERYLREYADRGALLDLRQQKALRTNEIEPASLRAGEVDGGLYGLSAGINAYAIVANPALFEAAEVELPDDETWTWEDYARIAKEITEKSSGVYGSQAYGNEETALSVWARQHGESLYTADGKLGVTAATVASWYQNLLNMQKDKGLPPADVTAQDMIAPLDQSLVGTNKVAMGWWWSNQLAALSKASGEKLTLLRLPSVTGKAAENGSYYKASMYWSISSRTEHPEEAAKFVDFLANTTQAGDIILSDRGVQPNTTVRAAIGGKLPAEEKAAQTFIEDIRDELGPVPAPPPPGGGGAQKILQRYTQEVLFERLPPAQAAERFLKELGSEITS
ncbi:multiple sugar transport system substrate-binding protein [Thermocatellispora tengchongensis]|uniref:Multiple sugar transport system substrate-binding protein n=1 Tax=Thermocatellispora tengchongensis TaxID=1073253 RepID=A0A840PJI4_9ACTN|nr:sugar ABC transporter substrate-binding protein [Thermocatellispora tengchongensis]MBB5139056.1 multiple sugar transport system substrate-binding protein [Thermocatellispora tengchongensis]